MGKKIIIAPIVEGFLSPLYKREHLFAPVVRRVLAHWSQDPEVEIWDQDFLSFGPGSQENVMAWMTAAQIQAIKESQDVRLLAFGKSKGGVEVREILMKELGRLIACFEKISLCIIDPHGNIVGDGVVGPYCKTRPLFALPDEISSMALKRLYISHVHQEHADPSGAAFPEANHTVKLIGQGVDHFSIVSHLETAQAIKLAANFVVA